MRPLLLMLLLTVATVQANAQRVVVIDSDTGDPVMHASIYTKTGKTFRSATTDYDGRANVRFTFNRLTVSHLNYYKQTLTALPDTIRLRPRYTSVPEVTVTNREPAWVRPMLKRIAKKKASTFLTRSDTMSYTYNSQSIGRQSYYHLTSTGDLRLKSGSQKHHQYRAHDISVTSADTTRLTDFMNLRVMLYEDFYERFSRSFISDHWFRETDQERSNKNEVELFFRSKRGNDDRGRMVVDTARLVILSAHRVSGTESNKRRLMSPFLLGLSRVMSGYQVLKWDIDYAVEYGEHNGNIYPATVRYKSYMENVEPGVNDEDKAFGDSIGGGFPCMEATLQMHPAAAAADTTSWTPLHESWFIRLGSDAERLYDIRLNNQPAHFTILREDE